MQYLEACNLVDVVLSMKKRNAHFMDDILHLTQEEDTDVLRVMLSSFAAHYFNSDLLSATRVYLALLICKSAGYRWMTPVENESTDGRFT